MLLGEQDHLNLRFGAMMFVIRSRRELGEGLLEATMVAASGFAAAVVRRNHLAFDSAYVPALRRPAPNVVLYFLCSGGLEVNGSVTTQHHGPAVFLLDENTLEGVQGQPRVAFRSWGEPFLLVDLRVTSQHVIPAVGPQPAAPLVVSDAVWAAARAFADEAIASDSSDDRVTASCARLLATLTEAHVLRPEVMPAAPAADAPADEGRHGRLWSAIRDVAKRDDLLVSLEALASAAGLSVRHIARDVSAFTEAVNVPFVSWRVSTRRLRFKVAILAVSADALSIADAARLAGYGSVEAMARAFRDAGAPTPSRVRQQLRAARERLKRH